MRRQTLTFFLLFCFLFYLTTLLATGKVLAPEPVRDVPAWYPGYHVV